MAKKSSRKRDPETVILVDRKAYLSACTLTSVAMQAMGDEFEFLRSAEGMNPQHRKDMMMLVKTHIRSMSAISHALQLSIHDLEDPDGTRGRDLN